jgi:hypothetical protein
VQTYLTAIHLGLQKIVSGGQTGNINGAEFKRELIKNSRVNISGHFVGADRGGLEAGVILNIMTGGKKNNPNFFCVRCQDPPHTTIFGSVSQPFQMKAKLGH